jgi:uncharacterized protein with FMN-binding domain
MLRISLQRWCHARACRGRTYDRWGGSCTATPQHNGGHWGGSTTATPTRVVLTFLALLLSLATAAADTVELFSGSKLEGTVTERTNESITIKTTAGGRAFTRKLPLDRVRAVTVDGRREVLNAKAGDAEKPVNPGDGQRTKAEVEALIERLGSTPPEWWDSVPLNYPKSLDLAWPAKPPEGWNNQRNVGQYVWDIVNPNPNKWREGVRLMHHLLSVHKDNPETQARAMQELGRMYYGLLQDHARAAYWWRKAGVDRRTDGYGPGVHLAECYWKLGNKPMAVAFLEKLPPQFAAIKLWADMGDLRRALSIADPNSKGAAADVALIYAGDACRVAGQYPQALQYYERLLALPVGTQAKGRIERNQRRAAANVQAIKLFDTLDLRRVPDGTYHSASLGYEADVQVEVLVKANRIDSVRVTGHREKQFYSSLTETPRKIIEKQSVKGIDATSGATITSEAIINATAKALSGAMKP